MRFAFFSTLRTSDLVSFVLVLRLKISSSTSSSVSSASASESKKTFYESSYDIGQLLQHRDLKRNRSTDISEAVVQTSENKFCSKEKQTYRQPWKRETGPESLELDLKASSSPSSEKVDFTEPTLKLDLQTKQKLVNRNFELTLIYTLT